MPRSPSPARDPARSKDRPRSPVREIKKRRERGEEDRRANRERSPVRREEKREYRRDDRGEGRRDDRRDDRRDRRDDPRREVDRVDAKADRAKEDGRREDVRKERGSEKERGAPRRSRSRERRRSRSREREAGQGGAPSAAFKEEAEEEEEGDIKAPPAFPGPPQKAKAEPLSLEELLKKKKEQQELDAKPKFLSKKERESLALQRRAEEAAAIRSRADEARRLRDGSLHPGQHGGAEERRAADARRAADDQRRRGAAAEAERGKVLEAIKQQYLGGAKAKKRVLRPSEKFRFNFDWEASEDTSRDLNPLYNNLHEAALLYGRGMKAGIDRREQKRVAAGMEQELMRKHRLAAGIHENSETRKHERERARIADQYDGFDMRVEKHWTDKALEDMTERDWRIFREDYSIQYKGTSTAGILPIRSWAEADLPEPIMQAIEKVNYKEPSAIQRAAIPLGLKFRDVIGVAETGSGKTAAFVIPMLTYIMKQPPMTEENEADGPYSLVMAPTRELAQQIEEEIVKLAAFTTYRVVSVVGGQDITEQGTKLRRGCEIIVATPGRLADCIRRCYAVLNQCNYVVLDEADRMIDLGFEPQVVEVLDAMPSSNLKPESEEDPLEANRVYRTTYMFSATMPPQVERLARKYLRRPVMVNIGTAGRATDNVTQRVLLLKENEKPRRLEQELAQVDEKRAMVFVNTKRQCDAVYTHLDGLGYRCTVLHGGKSQDQRELSIKGFRDDTFNILIATDVAGRGIDVPDVALVVNYDMANTIEAYTHRIGRTGRAGKKGVALTLLTLSNTDVFYDLKKLLEESKAPVPPELARHEAAKHKPGGLDGKPKRSETLFTH